MAVPQDTLADIRRDFERVPADLVKEAAKFPAAILADVQGRRGTMNSRVAAIGDGMAFAGPAFTVEVRGGDNLLLHAALNLAKPGDVIVCDGKDDMSCALMGALMMNHAKAIGLAAPLRSVLMALSWNAGSPLKSFIAQIEGTFSTRRWSVSMP